jgi:hypothetical protein
VANNIPVSFDDAKENARTTFDAIQALMTEVGVPGFVAGIVGGVTCSIVFLGDVLLVLFVKGLIKVATPFAAGILDVISTARQENPDQFNEVIASAMSEMLGVDVSAGDLPGGKGMENTIARANAIGDKLHDLLTEEFGGLEQIDPEQGAKNARTFSGYAINFAVANSFMAILSEALTIGQLKEFRELGVETAQALGLGRLQRLALQPLIRNMIQQPYDLFLKSKLRPDRLSESQIVRALHAGQLDEGEAKQALAEKGYRDDDIELLIKDLAAKLSITELVHLIRYDEISEDGAIAKLTAAGLPEEDARLQLKAGMEARADAQTSGILSDLQQAIINQDITQEEFSAQLSDLPLTDEEERLFRKRVSALLERPRKTITFAELKAAVVKGDVSFDYVDNWLQREGYNEEDSMILTMSIIHAMENAEAKAAAAAKTAAKAAAAGKPAPATLPK